MSMLFHSFSSDLLGFESGRRFRFLQLRPLSHIPGRGRASRRHNPTCRGRIGDYVIGASLVSAGRCEQLETKLVGDRNVVPRGKYRRTLGIGVANGAGAARRGAVAGSDRRRRRSDTAQWQYGRQVPDPLYGEGRRGRNGGACARGRELARGRILY